MKLLLAILISIPLIVSAGVYGTTKGGEVYAITESGASIKVDLLCIKGIQYYKFKTERYAFSGRGYGAGYMAVAIDRKTMQPKLCKYKKPVAKK